MNAGPMALGARIGPNAILQFLPVLEAELGEAGLADVLAAARLDAIPDGSAMIDEDEVRRLHQAVRRLLPGPAPRLSLAAGEKTAEYILRHRIPRPVRGLLPLLPALLGERVLVSAIARHAWTFVGSGEFRVLRFDPLTLEIEGNPMVRQEAALEPVCHWHGAVFRALFRRLIGEDYRVRETRCAACGGSVCRFELHRGSSEPAFASMLEDLP